MSGTEPLLLECECSQVARCHELARLELQATCCAFSLSHTASPALKLPTAQYILLPRSRAAHLSTSCAPTFFKPPIHSFT